MKGIIFPTESERVSLLGDIKMWVSTIKRFGLDFYIVVDDKNVYPNWKDESMESYRVDNYPDAFKKLQSIHPGIKIVKVDDVSDAQELKDYTHPGDACYVIGSDGASHPSYTYDSAIKLFQKALWGVEAFVCVMYDRYSKGG